MCSTLYKLFLRRTNEHCDRPTEGFIRTMSDVQHLIQVIFETYKRTLRPSNSGFHEDHERCAAPYIGYF